MSQPDPTPQIPDSVSYAELNQLLRDKPALPLSPAIPELDLGGPDGGVCDLQFAILQLMERSTTGCNVLQLLSAAIHLLMEVEMHFIDQAKRAESELPPFDDVSSEDRAVVLSIFRGLIMSLKTAGSLNEEVFTSLMHTYGARRLGLIKDTITGVITPADFRSHLLISDGLLTGLNLERNSVTQYLERASKSD